MRKHVSWLWGMIAVAALALCLSLPAISSGDSPSDEWKAPASADEKKNPVPADANSIAAGKKVYVANCLACHGTTGKGDGPAAAALGQDHKPGDLPSQKTQQQSDGALFWKVTEGRKPMPAYSKLIPETQRWQVINYLRTFKSGGK